MTAYQWADVMKGQAPLSLRDLPCDDWVVKEDDRHGHVLLCLGMFCGFTASGWYRPIPEEDVEAARKLREVIDKFLDASEEG